jgi:hypothetical protein
MRRLPPEYAFRKTPTEKYTKIELDDDDDDVQTKTLKYVIYSFALLVFIVSLLVLFAVVIFQKMRK